MTDKEITLALLDDDNMDNIILTDDEGKTFELAQLGVVPLHSMVYGILDLVKINGQDIEEADEGLVMLELDYDDESDTYYVSTVEDDELFNEVMEVFEKLPVD